ncbi:MAG TPA: PLD nuclease N-terminal domain-containing protein [Tepidisphaeraceae bacterium]|nr:PLD nuclease N-terminal domain-containing protein [Tepidisphaeraceae bacterium]
MIGYDFSVHIGSWKEQDMAGLAGLLVLVLDIYALYLVLTGPGENGKKLLWVLLIVFFPLLGAILYFLLGRGKLA